MDKRDVLVNIISIIIHDRLSHNITENQACGAAELICDSLPLNNFTEEDIKNIPEYDRIEVQ